MLVSSKIHQSQGHSRIQNLREQRILFDRPIGTHTAQQVYHIANSLGHVCLWYYDHATYAKPLTGDHNRLLKLFATWTRTIITVVNDLPVDQPPSRMVVLFWVAPPIKLPNTIKKL